MSFSIKIYYFLGYFAICCLNSKLQNYYLSVPSWKKPLLKTVKYKWSVIPPGSTANLKTWIPIISFKVVQFFVPALAILQNQYRDQKSICKEGNLKMASEGKIFHFDIKYLKICFCSIKIQNYPPDENHWGKTTLANSSGDTFSAGRWRAVLALGCVTPVGGSLSLSEGDFWLGWCSNEANLDLLWFSVCGR